MKSKTKLSPPDKKKPFWFYIVLISIPLMFFLLLEISLRIFNYGYDNRQWIPASEGKLILNPDLARRYFFSSGALPYSIQDVFDEIKKPNTFRVFVLGESSAAGYPYLPVGSFSRYLKKRLELFYPELNIEVINLSMTAINSYTLLDLFPGVAGQNPDVVLIYTGHNEYYGALGAGSVESFGSSRTLVKMILMLNKLKTVELLRNAITSLSELFAEKDEGEKNGTLMSRMARDRYIPLNSDLYHKGLDQFSANMKEIFNIAQDNNIKIICGNLVSNYKDQFPFISVEDDSPRADSVFINAERRFAAGSFKEADSLFRLAKELDALRFRAPEDVNRVLSALCREFNYPLINIDSVFAERSPDGITGNNLMTDHLHPNLEGYFLIGDLFFNTIKNEGFLPPKDLPEVKYQDSLTRSSFNFSQLDSIIADFRIQVLKNDWPYRTKGEPLSMEALLQPKDHIDSIAFRVAEGTFTWERAQREAADYYLRGGNKEKFTRQVNVLISQYPVIPVFYERAASGLLKFGDYENAIPYLENAYELKRSAFSAKWLGTIYLSHNQIDKAIYYLKESIQYKSDDAQVHYNLSGAYLKKADYKLALKHVEECLRINPKYPLAAGLRAQLRKYKN